VQLGSIGGIDDDLAGWMGDAYSAAG